MIDRTHHSFRMQPVRKDDSERCRYIWPPCGLPRPRLQHLRKRLKCLQKSRQQCVWQSRPRQHSDSGVFRILQRGGPRPGGLGDEVHQKLKHFCNYVHAISGGSTLGPGAQVSQIFGQIFIETEKIIKLNGPNGVKIYKTSHNSCVSLLQYVLIMVVLDDSTECISMVW